MRININAVTILFVCLGLLACVSAGWADTTTITGTAGGPNGGHDNWNNPDNWDNGIPTGDANAVVAAGIAAQCWNNDTPEYTGTLTLLENSSLQMGWTTNYPASFNALGGAGVTMHEGTQIRLRLPFNLEMPALVLDGNASVHLSPSTSAHHKTRTFNEPITGPGALTLIGNNNNTAEFTIANPDWSGGLIANADDGWRIVASATGALGTGDVIINDRPAGDRGVTLVIGAADVIDDGATLYLNGAKDNRQLSKLILNADETVAGFWVNGVEMPMGTYDSASGLTDSLGSPLITGAGTLTVDPGIPVMEWFGQGGSVVGNWSDAGNWVPGLVSDGDVTIDVDGAEVTVDADAAAWRVLLGQTAASALTVPAGVTLSWTDSANGGLNVGPAGTLTVDGALVGPVLNVSGTATFHAGADLSGLETLSLNGGTVNGSGPLLLKNVTVDGGAFNLGSNDLTVTERLVVRSGSLDTATQLGSLDVSTAELHMEGGTLATDQDLTAARLTYDAGTVALGGRTLTVGQLLVRGDLDTSSGVLAAADVTVTGATLTVGNHVAAQTLTLDGGNVAGAGSVTADVKYSFTNVANYAGDITGAAATLVIGEAQTSDATVKLTGTNNTYGGITDIRRGVLEVNANAANLGSGRLEFNSLNNSTPAILQTSGTFERQLGATNGLYFRNTGGFAASDAPLTVTLLRGDGQDLPLQSTDAVNGFRAGLVQMGSPTARSVVTLTNDIDFTYHANWYTFDNPATSADIAVLSGDLHILNPSHFFHKQGQGTLWLTGNNDFNSNRLQISSGPLSVVRAQEGVGLPTAAVLFFNDGVFESSGTFTREIGNASGMVYWNRSGGFAAAGGPLTVTLTPAGGAPGDVLPWDGAFRNQRLYLGSPTADDVVTLTNPIDGRGGNRTIMVSGNPESDTDGAVLSGDVIGMRDLYVQGTAIPGELRFTGKVTTQTGLYVRSGAVIYIDGTAEGLVDAGRWNDGGTIAGTGSIGTETTAGHLRVRNTGIVAPGDSVGTLHVIGDVSLQNGSTYEWQVGQPGSTDVIDVAGGTVNLDEFVLRILDAGGFVADPNDPLVVFTYDADTVTIDMGGFGNDEDNFDTSALGPKGGLWDWTSLALTDDGAGTIYLTGLAGGVSPIDGTMTWAAGADGLWDEPNWAAAGFIPPGSEPNFPDDAKIAVVIDTPWTVTVQGAEREAFSVDLRGGGTLAVDAASALTAAFGVTVAADGALRVAGGLHTPSLDSAGTTEVLAGGLLAAGNATVAGGSLDVADGGELNAIRLSLAGGALHVAGGGVLDANRTDITGGSLNVDAAAAVNLRELTISGGSVNLSEDVDANNVEITGGSLDTGEKGIRVAGALRAADAVVTSDAPSFRAMGSGVAGEVTVGMTAENSTTTITPAAGPGGPLNAPTLNLRSFTGAAFVEFDATTATVGDLSFTDGSGMQLPAGVDVSIRNLLGTGSLFGDVTVRGAIRPGPKPGWMEVFGAVQLAPGAAFQPEIQGPNSPGTLFVDTVLDLSGPGDALAVTWAPTDDPNSAFGGTYLLAEVGAVDGEFDILGSGNIGEAYIASVAYDVDLGGTFGIEVTLYDLLRGDADLDGDVDGGDFAAVEANFGAEGTSRAEGDLTYDGRTDAMDYLAWKLDVGNAVPGLVPEPATGLLLLPAVAVLAAGRRRRRKR